MCNLLAALLLLVSGLFVTTLLALNPKADLEKDAKSEFDFASNQITEEVTERFNELAQILYNDAALFAALNNVTHQV